jgi:excisionase family DNA binding protein
VTKPVLEQLAAVLADALAPAGVDEIERRGYLTKPDPTPFLSVDEAAEHLAAKPQRVYDLLSSGRLTLYKTGHACSSAAPNSSAHRSRAVATDSRGRARHAAAPSE